MYVSILSCSSSIFLRLASLFSSVPVVPLSYRFSYSLLSSRLYFSSSSLVALSYICLLSQLSSLVVACNLALSLCSSVEFLYLFSKLSVSLFALLPISARTAFCESLKSYSPFLCFSAICLSSSSIFELYSE